MYAIRRVSVTILRRPGRIVYMKILVTGASGFIGRELAQRHEVVGLARGRPELGVPGCAATSSSTRICSRSMSIASTPPCTWGR